MFERDDLEDDDEEEDSSDLESPGYKRMIGKNLQQDSDLKR